MSVAARVAIDAATPGPPSGATPSAARLYRDGYALGVSTVASAGLGFGAWVLAARVHTPREIGYASGLLQAVLLLSAFGLVNLSAGLIRFLPVAGTRAGRFTYGAYTVSAASTFVLAMAFALARPAHLFDATPVGGLLAFAALAVIWSVFTLQDSALTGLGAAPWVACENTSFGLMRVGALVVLGATGGRWGIVASWFLPAVLLIAVINLGPLRTRLAARAGQRPLTSATAVKRYVAATWLPTALQHAVQLATPLVVLAAVGPERASAFSMAWLLITNVELVSIGFGNALVVQAAQDHAALTRLLHAALRRQYELLGLGLVALAVFARQALSVFGPTYAAQGTTTLRLLALAMLPRIFSVTVTSGARIAGRLRAISALQLPITVGEIVLAAVLAPRWGLVAVGWATLVIQSAVAVASVPLWRSLTSEER